MGKSLLKDIFREIVHTKKRFLSLFFIVLMGVGVFGGIKATSRDMKLTADKYADDYNLMDIQIISTMGLTQSDADSISKIKGVKAVDPTYSIDAVVNKGNNGFVIKVHGLDLDKVKNDNSYINKPKLIEGRFPENNSECVVEAKFLKDLGYSINDIVTLNFGTQNQKNLKNNKFKIVGVVETPYYISRDRGASTIGNGQIQAFMMVPETAFSMDSYTEIDVLVNNAKKLFSYSDEYYNLIQPVKDDLVELGKKRSEIRYNDIKNKVQREIDDAKKVLASKESEYNKELSEAKTNKQISQAKNKIAQSEKKLNEIKKPVWYVLDRKSNIGFVEFGDEADRIKAIGNVFPTIFFLVAALVSLTTMTRMVEEQRTQMGILKALGYSKFAIMLKFVIYSVIATISGGIIGLFLGFSILPRVIFGAYSTMYTLPAVITEFNGYYAVLGIITAMISTTFVTIFVCFSNLKETPAALMRLKAPVAGRRVLLEKINFIWSRLGFIQKVTARNLFRYKKRFFMTVFGIGGCTALLLTGFGIRDSINTIVTKQYNEIFKYQMVTTFANDVSPNDITKLMAIIKNDKRIKESMLLSQSNIEVRNNKVKKSVFLVVPDNRDKFKDFILLRNRNYGTPISLIDNGVVITEKLSNVLAVKTGECIYIKNGNNKEVKVKVTGITKNYVQHYVYMSSVLYRRLFNESPVSNEIISKTIGSSKSLEDDLSQKMLKSPAAMTVNFTTSVKKTFQNVINNLLSVVLVLIVSAGSLAFVVLYNLTNINITERIRELATMKVLGFYDFEVSMYVIRENAILTIIGILLGFIMGIFLHRFVMTTSEVEILMFGRNIKPISFLCSALMTIGFSALVSIVVHFQLQKVDMVQSLKSPDID